MKKLSLFALAAAGLFMVSCADKDVVQDVQKPVSSEFKDGGYIGISLSLPSAENTTRANDSLSNGTEEEFAVKNATLYIFKMAKPAEGATAANPDEVATYVAKVSLGNTYDPDKQGGIDPDEWGVQDGVDETNITSTYNKATLIPNELASEMKADTQNTYYAYVIINHNGQVEVAEGDTFKDFADQEFEEIGADIAAEQKIWETGLLMTNAPICDNAGGSEAPADGAKYSTLVELDNQKIFGSKAEAEEDPAACVYVERAAVKITVEDNRTETKIEGYDVTIDGWQVINNEPSYYNTRHINNDGTGAVDWGTYFNADWTGKNTTYRFVSALKFEPTLPEGADHTPGYRTYFAKDLQYNIDAELENTVASDDRPWIAVGKHAYTTENTFDVAHQTWQNTTMVTLKTTIGKAGSDGNVGIDFYTVGKGSQIMYVDDADMTATDARSGEEKALAAIENIIKGDNDVASAMTALRTAISKNNPYKNVTSGLTLEITEAPTEGTTGVEFTVALDYTLDDNAYPATGQNFVENTTDPTKNEKALAEALETAIANVIYVDPAATKPQFKDEVLLSFYSEGVSYFNVKIKHFGDFETPWSAGGSYVTGGGADVNEIYGIGQNPDNSTANFLGRYGVVRDNWYKLSIDKIGKIGDAEPVDPSTITPDTPDDEIENFISVHVHIVPWVLREQSVQF